MWAVISSWVAACTEQATKEPAIRGPGTAGQHGVARGTARHAVGRTALGSACATTTKMRKPFASNKVKGMPECAHVTWGPKCIAVHDHQV